jgi:hypothetical protein
VSAKITLNGKPADGEEGSDVASGRVTVDGNTLYELINQKEFRNGVIEITADEPGLEAYAFTFGS